VKLVVVEAGSDLASELWNADQRVASSLLFYPEGRAALAAAHRGRRLTSAGYERSVAELGDIRRELAVMGIDEPLAEHAGELAAELGLRGYDAVHLASAISLGTHATALVTWDRDLRAAALEKGLAVAPSELAEARAS